MRTMLVKSPQRRGGSVCVMRTMLVKSPHRRGGSVRAMRHKRLKSTSVLLDYIVPAWAAKGPKQAQRGVAQKRDNPAHTV
jgi:hypothetical protein